MSNATLAVVVTSSSSMLPKRGMWILSSYAQRVPTFVIADDSRYSRKVIAGRACATVGKLTFCQWTSVSSVVLVPYCGGLEQHGCCRVFTFLRTAPPLNDWVAFVDDDVYVPECLSRYLPMSMSPLFAPSKHVGAIGGWRWSLCGDKGRPDTEIALPAGYGFANRAFVSKLVQQAPSMIRQCVATPAYNLDVALSFASWQQGINLTAVFDWTDPRVNWMGGQRHLWREESWIYHKVRTRYDFERLHYKRSKMCGMEHDKVKILFTEQYLQTGYKRTRHALTPSLRNEPFDCQ
jgi:hypothetical protein